MHRAFSKFAIVGAAFVAIIGLTVLIPGQEAPRQRTGMPQDWTHHHLVFSNPGSFAQATRNGSFVNWYRIMNDPRFQMQRLRREAASPSGVAEPEDLGVGLFRHLPVGPIGPSRPKPTPKPKINTLHKDWSVSLGTGVTGSDAWYPAKFYMDVGSVNCRDFVVFPTDVAGASGSQANLIGITGLYPFCNGHSTPSVSFSYFVGTASASTNGTVQTSPALSVEGFSVAYVESVSAASVFHVLLLGDTGSNGTSATSPASPHIVILDGTYTYPSGATNNAVDTGITMSGGGVSVTRSSPFIDYLNDVAYVGDDSGKLHKFTCVFNPNGLPCTLAEAGSPWPISVGASTILTGPVYDATSGNIFVGGSNGNLYYVREASSTVGTCSSGSPPCLGSTTVTLGADSAIVDAPLVDSSAGKVYAAINVTGTASYVVQAPTDLSSKVSATFGAPAYSELHNGDFDNGFYTTDSGYLYFCGNSTGATGSTLYRISITSGTMSAANDGSTLAVTNGTPNSDCAPLTEFYNTAAAPATDWLFLALPSNGYVTNPTPPPSLLCNSVPCVENFSLGSTFPAINTGFTIGGLSATSLSGIIIDNDVAYSGWTNNIYFADIGGHTAYQISQAGLE